MSLENTDFSDEDQCQCMYTICDLPDISFRQLLASLTAKYYQLKGLKGMEILSGEQMRVLRKM